MLVSLLFRFYQYKPTSLEQSFTYDLSAEHDLDVTIDLINPDTYRIDPNGEVFPLHNYYICSMVPKFDFGILFYNIG